MVWFWAGTNASIWDSGTTSATTSTAPTASVYWSNVSPVPWLTTTTTQAAAHTASSLYQQQALAQMYANGTPSQYQQQQAMGVWAQLMPHLHEQQMLAQLADATYQGGRLFAPSRPAIITRQEEERRLRAQYDRAMQEHDQQETDRLLRQLERHALLDAEERLRMEQLREQARAQQQIIETAKQRARELLFEHLSAEQRDTFDRNGWFVVEGGRSKTKYRIGNRGVAGNIDVLTSANRVAHRLCCHAQSHIPAADQWLAQKVMLELAEDDFLRIANRHAA